MTDIDVISLADFAREHRDIYAPHIHDDFLVIWFTEEGGTHMVDFCEYPVSANSLFLISPGQVHSFYKDCHMEGWVLVVSPEFVHGEPDGENLLLKYQVHRMGVPYYTITDPYIIRNLTNMLEAIRVELRSNADEVMHRVMLKLHASAFSIMLCRECEAQRQLSMAELRPVHRLYILFRRELSNRYAELHSVRQYAELLGVSAKTLTNAVSESVGRSPGQLIDEQITIHAKRLLSCTHMRIKEVADALGFADVANFGKFFRKNTGFLPKEFRESPRH